MRRRGAAPGTVSRSARSAAAAASTSPSATRAPGGAAGPSLRSPPAITGLVDRGQIAACQRGRLGRPLGRVGGQVRAGDDEPGAAHPSSAANAAPRMCRPGRQREPQAPGARAPGPAGVVSSRLPSDGSPPAATTMPNRSASAAHLCRQRNRRGASCTITTSGASVADDRRERAAVVAQAVHVVRHDAQLARPDHLATRAQLPPGQVGGADDAGGVAQLAPARTLGDRQPAALGQRVAVRRARSGPAAAHRPRSRRRRPPAPAGRGSAPGRPAPMPEPVADLRERVAGDRVAVLGGRGDHRAGDRRPGRRRPAPAAAAARSGSCRAPARAKRTRALPLAYCSMQPSRPQPHGCPPGTDRMWPSSAAMPCAPRDQLAAEHDAAADAGADGEHAPSSRRRRGRRRSGTRPRRRRCRRSPPRPAGRRPALT